MKKLELKIAASPLISHQYQWMTKELKLWHLPPWSSAIDSDPTSVGLRVSAPRTSLLKTIWPEGVGLRMAQKSHPLGQSVQSTAVSIPTPSLHRVENQTCRNLAQKCRKSFNSPPPMQSCSTSVILFLWWHDIWSISWWHVIVTVNNIGRLNRTDCVQAHSSYFKKCV